MILPGNLDYPTKVLFNAVPDLMNVGGGVNPRDGVQYACIQLVYPSDVHHAVLWIAKGMVQRGKAPQVYLAETEVGTSVFVQFVWSDILTESLRELIPRVLVPLIAPFIGRNVEVITLAEVEFPSGQLEVFLEYFTRNQRIRLFILEERQGRREPVWGVQLHSYTKGFPTFNMP